MDTQLLHTLISNEQNVCVTLSLADLREVVGSLVREERQRIESAIEREREKPSLTRQEAARMMGVSVSTLGRMAQDGQLVPIKIGTKVRYKQSDIDEYLAQNRKILHL